MVFCFEITFKIVKMRSISVVDFFSYEFVNGVMNTLVYFDLDVMAFKRQECKVARNEK